MANSEQIEIVSPSGQVRFYELNPALGIVNIGQHPDNDLVLDGQDVRPFHALIDHRSHPYQYISLEEDGGFGAERPLGDWERLRIGEYELVLMSGERAGQRLSTRNTAPSSDYTQNTTNTPTPAAAGGEVRWRAKPGQTLRHNLTIQNSGDSPATFVIGVSGVPTEWLWLSQETISLPPGGQAALQLAVSLPPGPATEPGIYPLTWQMESPDYPGWAQSEALYLEVEATPAVQMSKPEPVAVVSRPFRRAGQTHVTIANWGNIPAQVYVSGQERRNDCVVQIDPVLDRPAPEEGVAWERPQANGLFYPTDLLLLLPPGALAHLRLIITPNAGRRFGIGAIHHRFTVTAQSPTGAFAPQTSAGSFESRPAIRMGFLLLLAFLLALGALYFLRGNISAGFGRVRSEPLAFAPTATVPHLAWLAPSAETVVRPLLATGGARAREPGELTYTEMFQEIADLYGMDWRQLVAHAQRESRLDPNAQGGSGEYGLMQILPTTWNEWAPLVEVSDPWDPYSNILVGAAYYSYIHSYFSDLGYADPQWSLAAYNWGPERTLGLLDSGGDWFALPLPQRMYVADILIGMENAPALAEDAELRYPHAK